MRILADTGLLVRYSLPGDPSHQLCRGALDALAQAGHQLCTCCQGLAEFWAVSTRPADVNGLGMSFDKAMISLRAIETAFTLLPEPPDVAQYWRRLIEDYRVLGKQAHDARLAALMLAHGVTHILTLNPRDFARYDGITPVTPQEIHQTP